MNTLTVDRAQLAPSRSHFHYLNFLLKPSVTVSDVVLFIGMLVLMAGSYYAKQPEYYNNSSLVFLYQLYFKDQYVNLIS